MFRGVAVLLILAAAVICKLQKPVDYSGHKVLTVHPSCEHDLELLQRLRKDYGVDLWNEPRAIDVPVMVRLSPDLVDPVTKLMKEKNIRYEVAIPDVQRAIVAEKIQNAATNYTRVSVSPFDFGKYHQYAAILQFLDDLVANNHEIVKKEEIGKSYENRAIYSFKVSSSGAGNTKPAIMIECGIHAREWTSVAACLHLLHSVATGYKKDPIPTTLIGKYDIYFVPEANPDGYIYTWTMDRLWRKTRSRSNLDWLGVCRGADANRNFDIEHCGVGTSRKPCDDIYCGDSPFSENESRALRDLMVTLGDRLKAYISLHAFSELWMTPYGTTKKLPPNYSELERVGKIGAKALSRKYGTQYKVGSIANIIYEATGSSVDYAYVKQNVKMAYALELRDKGRYGFFLPLNQIEPTCEETTEGILAAIQALE